MRQRSVRYSDLLKATAVTLELVTDEVVGRAQQLNHCPTGIQIQL